MTELSRKHRFCTSCVFKLYYTSIFFVHQMRLKKIAQNILKRNNAAPKLGFFRIRLVKPDLDRKRLCARVGEGYDR